MGRVATYSLPPGGSKPLQSGGYNHKWPTTRPCGYMTPTAWRVPTASKRGGNQKWPTTGPGGWLHKPCCPGAAHSFRVGARIGSGPQVRPVAT